MTPEQLTMLYTASNCIIAASMISIALAIGFATIRKRAQYPWLSTLFSAVFLTAGISRILKVFESNTLPGIGEISLDVVCGILSLATTFLAWPLAFRALKQPTYLDLKIKTKQLEEAREMFVKQEEERRELNNTLEQQLAVLADANATIKAARDHALEASNLKSAFVANISHELRTPLSGILGMAELMLFEEKCPPDVRTMAETIHESSLALLTVVNDILDLSKIEAGKIKLEFGEFNPQKLVEDSTKLLTPAAQNKNLELRLVTDEHVPPAMYGDASRIRQVLLNLIGNAVKFTDRGSVTVETHLVTDADETARVRFSVRDTGIGIAEEDRRLLFRPFIQVDNTSTRKFGGTGLGLTISKAFVEMMGGTMGLDSVKGQGSTFWFEIPFDKRKVFAPEAATPDNPPGAKNRPIPVEPQRSPWPVRRRKKRA
jgi:signal transduction histidine kinase